MNKLKKAIIEKIHGLPWEEARWVEYTGYTRAYIVSKGKVGKPEYGSYYFYDDTCDIVRDYEGDMVEMDESDIGPITLSRVLQALEKTDMYGGVYELNASETSWWLKFKQYSRADKKSRFQIDTAWLEWKLLKADKSTATLEDQSEETILALTKIFLTD